ncbi:MAG: hypothetical protein ABSA33_07445, partial [Candidatus Micrarchaeaceae archaeon]
MLLGIFAILPLNAVHAQSTLTLSIHSATNEYEIDGYNVMLYQNGQVINSGLTPTTFSVIQGQTYSIQADNNGSYCFDYWNNYNTIDYSNSNPLTFTAESDPGSTNYIGLVAVYTACGTSTSTTTTTS